MAVNLVAWEDALKDVRERLRRSEENLLALANQTVAQNKIVNAYRDELKHLEQLDTDLTELLRARGESRL